MDPAVNSLFPKRRELFYMDECLLVSKVGLCSVELHSNNNNNQAISTNYFKKKSLK
jgi:hypothetical protein